MAYSTIEDPSAHFQAIGWTGNDVDGRALTNDGNSNLQPDLVWLKAEVGYNHFWIDSSRGVTKYMSSNTDTAETTWTDLVESFDTNGFTIGDDGSQVPNHTGNIHHAWQWKANGGTTSSNTDGDITSTVQANTTAGFSIVTYTGNTSNNQTVGHGLGAKPSVIIIRNRNRAETWRFNHQRINSGTGMIQMNNTTAYNTSATTLMNAAATSTTFSVSTDWSVNGAYPFVAWCWAEVQGYSKFGTYKGNGDAQGPFVYTGFKPAFILFKKSSDTGDNWMMYDHKRPGYNVTNKAYHPNSSAAEYTNANTNLDMLSNGFKLRSSHGWVNQSSHTYMYMAFAEQPLVANGIPTTAR